MKKHNGELVKKRPRCGVKPSIFLLLLLVTINDWTIQFSKAIQSIPLAAVHLEMQRNKLPIINNQHTRWLNNSTLITKQRLIHLRFHSIHIALFNSLTNLLQLTLFNFLVTTRLVNSQRSSGNCRWVVSTVLHLPVAIEWRAGND